MAWFAVAFPLIGGGTGGVYADHALQCMERSLADIETPAQVLLVRYRR